MLAQITIGTVERCRGGPWGPQIFSFQSAILFMSAITTQTNGEVLVVGFTDSKILESRRIEQIGKDLQDSVKEAVNKKLLLNFRGVSFMSSAMITKLVMLNKLCKAQGIALKFCEVSPNVMEVFKITKLNKLFDIQGGEEKALASFEKKGWFG
ncbi:MAG: STAS domain-containing protein [Planctomycetota bacterium]